MQWKTDWHSLSFSNQHSKNYHYTIFKLNALLRIKVLLASLLVNPLAQSCLHEPTTEWLAEANPPLERLASSDGWTRGATRYQFQAYWQTCWHKVGKRILYLHWLWVMLNFLTIQWHMGSSKQAQPFAASGKCHSRRSEVSRWLNGLLRW